MEEPRIDTDSCAVPDSTGGETGSPKRESRTSMFLQASILCVASGVRHPLRVRNISSGGLMGESPHGFAVGDRIELELRGVGQQAGKIAWAAHGKFGVAFDYPINPMLTRRPVKSEPGAARFAVGQNPWRPGLRIR